LPRFDDLLDERNLRAEQDRDQKKKMEVDRDEDDLA
jgi:hypothetical protein